ncbi:LysR family transcriptional regulator [Pseudoduganella sp. FT25W]|uniref:LysR family transcriptional regulator n=1 Tax=Duganella alba TaxID=2666081 RepID=A0A6L5QJ77_9BURK|nr:LysR family transcriptional regulator [Duganella alba]MRX09740.1 LysR family transcriptional regulator [Duganella alba]MRX17377.1 LysR family transcriptional regulator [Duganella alba]
MDELRAISTFIRAAELGSFNKVAEAQGTTPQAVSKTIRQFEQHLGVRLFHRTTRNSSLTEEGQRLLESIKPSMDGVVGALARARSAAREDEGTIRVAASGSMGRRILMPLLAEFQLTYPGIQIDLIQEDGFSDLVHDRIDVGFRGGNAPDAQIVSRRLFAVQQIVCASPDYLKRHGVPRTLQDLQSHRCTAYRQPGSGRPMAWEFEIDGDTVFHHVQPVLLSNDPDTEMHAVLAGIGIGQIDSINATAAIRAGLLKPLLTGYVSERMGFYLYFPQRADMPARVRRFVDFIVERLLNSQEFCINFKLPL